MKIGLNAKVQKSLANHSLRVILLGSRATEHNINNIYSSFLSNEKLVRFSLFDIHFSEVSSFFVIRYSTFIFQKLVRFSLFVIRHSFFRS